MADRRGGRRENRRRHAVEALQRLRDDGLASGMRIIGNQGEGALCAVFALTDSILNHPTLSVHPGITRLRGASLASLLYGLIVGA